MSLQDFHPLLCSNPDVRLLFIALTYDGSGVPTVTTGKGATVTDDGTGLFTLTTKFSWRAFLGGANLSLSATAGGRTAEVVSKSQSARTVSFRITNAAGSAADPGNGDGMYVMLAFQVGGAMPA